MNLIMIGLIRLQVSKNGITGVIIGNTGGGWLRYLVKLTLDCSISNGEFSRIGGSPPYPYRIRSGIPPASGRELTALDHGRRVSQEIVKQKK